PVAESIYALRPAALTGIEREPRREALAAALVKDEVDRETFDDVFDRFFVTGERVKKKRLAKQAAGEEGRGLAGGEESSSSLRPRPEPRRERGDRPAPVEKKTAPSATI